MSLFIPRSLSPAERCNPLAFKVCERQPRGLLQGDIKGDPLAKPSQEPLDVPKAPPLDEVLCGGVTDRIHHARFRAREPHKGVLQILERRELPPRRQLPDRLDGAIHGSPLLDLGEPLVQPSGNPPPRHFPNDHMRVFMVQKPSQIGRLFDPADGDSDAPAPLVKGPVHPTRKAHDPLKVGVRVDNDLHLLPGEVVQVVPHLFVGPLEQLQDLPPDLFSDLAHVPQVEVVAGPAAILLVNLPFPFGLGDESLEVPITRPDSQPLLPRTDRLSHIAPLKIRLSQEPVYLALFRIEIPGPPQTLYSPVGLPQAEKRHAQPHVKPRLLTVEVDRRLILSRRVPKRPFLKEGTWHVAVRIMIIMNSRLRTTRQSRATSLPEIPCAHRRVAVLR